MNCPICGAACDPIAFYCRSCYYLLLSDQDDEGARPEPGLRILTLAEACESASSGHWTSAQFQGFLDTFADEQRERERAYRDVPIPQGLEEDFEEEQDLMIDGMNACNQAIDILRGFDGSQGGRGFFERGLAKYWRGVLLVKEAMATNRRNVDRPVWF